VPVLDQLVSVIAGLVPEPALCPGAGAAERSQETLYNVTVDLSFSKRERERTVTVSVNVP
jgi:hypothetical protein